MSVASPARSAVAPTVPNFSYICPANKGKIYSGGLFGLSRHINYFGYTLWRSGYALAAGGWIWGSIVAGFFTYDFTQRAIPVLTEYMEERVSSAPPNRSCAYG